MTEPPESLDAKVDRLERRARRQTRLLTVLAVLAAGGVVMGQVAAPSPADEVRAKRLVVVGDGGEPRAGIAVAPGGTALLFVADASRRPRVMISVAAGGQPSVTLYDAGGARRAVVQLDGDDRPLVALSDKDGKALATSLTVAPNGNGLLAFADSHGTRRLVAGLIDDEATVVALGQDGKSGARLAVDAGTPRLALADSNGDERLWLAVRQESPVLQFFDRSRVARSGLTTINNDAGVAIMSEGGGPAPGVVLYDKDKKIIWSAP